MKTLKSFFISLVLLALACDLAAGQMVEIDWQAPTNTGVTNLPAGYILCEGSSPFQPQNFYGLTNGATSVVISNFPSGTSFWQLMQNGDAATYNGEPIYLSGAVTVQTVPVAVVGANTVILTSTNLGQTWLPVATNVVVNFPMSGEAQRFFIAQARATITSSNAISAITNPPN